MHAASIERMHAEAAFMDERRSHSYDESFLYHGNDLLDYQQPMQMSSLHRKPPLYQANGTRDGPPLVSRDDLALGTTVVSPLGRFRAQYEREQQQQLLQQRQQQM